MDTSRRASACLIGALALAAPLAACAGGGDGASRAQARTLTGPAAGPSGAAPVATTAKPTNDTGTTAPSASTSSPTGQSAPGAPTGTIDPPVATESPQTEALRTTAAPAAAAPAPAAGAFEFQASAIGPDIRARMEPTSWRPGCPVPLEDLRYVRLTHWGFDGQVHLGELVVHATAVADVEAVFARLFAAGFPIRQMRLVDDFGGDDFTSIEADNTSAFNCRPVTGSSTAWSEHAYGRAIDINPIENPYVYADGTSDHAASAPFLDRSVARPGMASEGGVLVAAFDGRGWGWGGRWQAPVDYQHFSSSGR